MTPHAFCSSLLLATALAFGSGIGAAQAAKPADNSATDRTSYIVVFDEPGLLHYEGSIPGLRATAPSATGQAKLDVNSEASQAYLAHLAQVHEARIDAIESTIPRELGDVYRYDIALSGVGLRIDAAEAARLAGMPGVKAIHRFGDPELDTRRGPVFIGANAIWDGTGVPGGVGSRGQGTVIGIIDSGTNQAHPSFGVLPAECGASAGEAKTTALTCLTGGVCGTGVVGATCATNNPGTPEDCNGHGSHTASTAGGNTLLTTGPAPAPVYNISGVAPCAKLINYKVCEGSSCNGTAIVASINRAIADGVEVLNYSISGGGGDDASVWTVGATADRLFLDALAGGVLVAASAGNTRAENPTPEGDVAHRGPWLTSVAASTHDAVAATNGSLQVTGPGTVPGNLAAPIVLTASSAPPQIAPNAALQIRHFAAAVNGCNADPAYPANFFAGGTALISRGVCPFAEKAIKAQAAGATSVIIYNNAAGGITMAGMEAVTIPAYSILQTEGNALIAFFGTLGGNPVLATGQPAEFQGDVLAGFSLRGPISPVAPGAQGSNNSFDVTKPDITAPGVSIYAAVNSATNYGNLSGTSMSSPHVAGAYALLRAVQPGWTASEIKSALMMTAFNDGFREDGETPWSPDDVGSGRADLTRAARAGLVMDETVANFLAADPGLGGDVRALNLASIRHTDCNPSCTFTRTVQSTLPVSAQWLVTVNNPPGFEVEVSPSSFTLVSNNASQELTITATATTGSGAAAVTFGDFVMSTVTAGQSPDLRVTMALRGEGADLIFADGFDEGGGNPDIVVFDNVNFAPPATLAGGSVKWDDGTTCTCDTTPFDFNIYATGGNVAFFWPRTTTEGAVAVGTVVSVLAPGTVVGPGSTFTNATGAATAANWRNAAGVDGYMGFRFVNPATTEVNYGYARITTGPSATGFPATIVSYAFNQVGDPITIP
jgi:subtilisin family serine protease